MISWIFEGYDVVDIPGDIVKAVAVVVTVVVVVEVVTVVAVVAVVEVAAVVVVVVVVVVEVVEEMVVVGGGSECGVMVFLEILLTYFTNFK